MADAMAQIAEGPDACLQLFSLACSLDVVARRRRRWLLPGAPPESLSIGSIRYRFINLTSLLLVGAAAPF